jgi:glycosyltransferase involved in cell wall biosynthesis
MEPVPSPANACIVVPAFDAERTLGLVLSEIEAALPGVDILVIDDGSRDRTAAIARERGVVVVPSRSRRGEPGENHGKGAALRTALEEALARGLRVMLSVDADGQHPAEEAARIFHSAAPDEALVLGVRDLAGAGAPRANRFSNAFSNFFLSRFAGRPLPDTQCGLRRYPVASTLALGVRGERYDFEAEVLLRAAWAGVPLAFEPIRVLYPPDRETHFKLSEDPWRILANVLTTYGAHRIDQMRARIRR